MCFFFFFFFFFFCCCFLFFVVVFFLLLFFFFFFFCFFFFFFVFFVFVLFGYFRFGFLSIFPSKRVDLVWERIDQNEKELTKMSTIWPKKDELTEEKFYYELPEKWVRAGQNESELTYVRIDLRTNWPPSMQIWKVIKDAVFFCFFGVFFFFIASRYITLFWQMKPRIKMIFFFFFFHFRKWIFFFRFIEPWMKTNNNEGRYCALMARWNGKKKKKNDLQSILKQVECQEKCQSLISDSK